MNPRHADRRRALDALYQADVMGIRPTAVLTQWREATGEGVAPFTEELVAGVEEERDDLDILIGETAKEWTVDRMAVVDRVALIPLCYGRNVAYLREGIAGWWEFSKSSAGFADLVLDA